MYRTMARSERIAVVLSLILLVAIIFELGVILGSHLTPATVTSSTSSCAPIEILPGIYQPWHPPYACK